MEPAVPAAPTQPGHERRLRPPTLRVALVVIALALLVLVLLAAAPAVKPFLLGVVLVYLVSPLVDRLAATGLPRALSVLLVFVLVIVVVGAIGALALTPLIQQVRQFADDLPQLLADARVFVDQFYDALGLSPEIRQSLDRIIADVLANLESLELGGLLAPLVSSLASLLGSIAAYAILPAWLFFVLKDRARLREGFEQALPVAWRDDVASALLIVSYVFGRWIRGQLLLGAVVGVASYIGLMLLSAFVDPVFGRYAVLLAIVAGVLELVPFIGPIIAAIPAVLIGLTVGPVGFVAALLLYLVIQQLENNVLVPKIQGDAVDLHPSLVMIALIVGASLGGILGAIASLPVAAASRDLFRYLFRRLSDPPASVDDALATISPRLVVERRRYREEHAAALSDGPPTLERGTAPPEAAPPETAPPHGDPRESGPSDAVARGA